MALILLLKTRDNTSSVADAHHSENSSLVANEHQSRGINGREANVLPLTVNPPATTGVEESGKDCPHGHKLLDSSVAFYPEAVAPSNELRLNTHQVITNYLKQHFRSSLSKDIQSSMHKNLCHAKNTCDKNALVESLHYGTFERKPS